MNKLQHISLLSISLALLAGCATSAIYGDARTDGSCFKSYIDERRLASELNESIPCCDSFVGMSFVPLKTDAATPYGFTKTSPAYAFPSGKSRFAAFELGPVTPRFLVLAPQLSGRTAVIEDCKDFKLSVLVGDGSEWYRAVEPVVTFLDNQKRVLVEAVGAQSADTGDYGVPVPAGARYAVIHTLPGRYGIQRYIFKTPDNISVVTPGTAGAISLRGPSRLAAVVTSTGWFTVGARDN